jgi:hypothetical protein
MRKFLYVIEVILMTALFIGFIWASVMLAIGIDTLLTADWQHWVLFITLANVLGFILWAGYDQLYDGHMMYRIACHDARIHDLTHRSRYDRAHTGAQSAMRHFNKEVAAWQAAVNTLARK